LKRCLARPLGRTEQTPKPRLHFGFGEVGRVSSRTDMTPSIHPVTGRTVVDVAVIEPM
jgi:hypothetical protein